MSLPDYEVHLDADKFDALWRSGDEDTSESYPFGEDTDELDRIIEEEIGPSRRSRRRKGVER